MGKQAITLDGEWRLRGWSPDGAETMELAASTPGHVHLDLLSEGRLPDPFWRDNADACQWVEKWDWEYERTFDAGPDPNTSWALLQFDGLDTQAEVSLNGQAVGCAANMHIPHEFEVGALLRPGVNTLRVRFPSIWRALEGKPMDLPAAFTSERVHIRRMQCTFHWDWVNRFVSYGVWRPARLAMPDTARLTDLSAVTPAIDDSGASVRIEAAVERRGSEAVGLRVRLSDPDGATVAEWDAPGVGEKLELAATVVEPQLWWPNGQGEQPLYTVSAWLTGADGRELDARRVRLGLRTVAIEEVDDAPGSPEEARTRELRVRFPEDDRNGDAPGRSFIVTVNGRRIFCQGGNWVPADPWPSRTTAAQYDHLLGLAAEAGINCLRVWGGGIYEPEPFWEACDRLGILICQDFMMACGKYPEDDPAFMEALRAEAPVVVRRLRNHASLAWWSGDNENGMHFDADDPETWGKRIADEITGPVCAELDPTRPFYPTSPYGGKKNTSVTIGDCHWTALVMGRADLDDLPDYRGRIARRVGRFHSECTSSGVPALSSLRRFMTDDELADPTHPLWYFHTKDNPYLDIRLYDLQRQSADVLYGPSETMEGRIGRMQTLQREWVRLVVEALRRSKWYCAGILFWMYNDCWPATGWSMVDAYGVPKAGWYGMKSACNPLVCSIEAAEGGFRVWVVNATQEAVSGTLRLAVQPWTGAPAWQMEAPFTAPANASGVALVLDEASGAVRALDKGSVLVADLQADGHSDRTWYYPGMPHEMAPPPTRLSVAPGDGTVTIATEGYARSVMIEGDVVAADNYFDMLPGETRTIAWRPVPGLEPPTEVRVTCWNMA
jgi:beta-mannosidase